MKYILILSLFFFVSAQAKEDWPKTIDQAVIKIIKELPKESEDRIARMSEREAAMLHMSLGRWVRNSFGLWAGNKELLKSSGSENMHPDSASTVILQALRVKLRESIDPKTLLALELQHFTVDKIKLKNQDFDHKKLSYMLKVLNSHASKYFKENEENGIFSKFQIVSGNNLNLDREILLNFPPPKEASISDFLRWVSFRQSFKVIHQPPNIILEGRSNK